MPIRSIIDGQTKHTLFSGTAASVPGSTGLGAYSTSKYARFGGVLSVVGSVTLRWRMGIDDGNYQVTSSVVINSGAAVFDVLNYGRFTDFNYRQT